ncbi:glycerol-3-phosphate 1-O-acyltransferase PlsY [Psychrobacillus glaciei]|uniref:Glycerol-3-phosphate acyltransferase n=1 Tax=Psychrobacillus glaciei TaxID=2283160 RepID=A0A5J6SMF7_9BACI|nr:glycerol-3-phosphate 1-O-acyltransferase PlsY [Psychrobacillus glaciei]QFF99078.1 glycerol-3-phosphate 1-O-acyltransferase PlsY [Psychrobacillus glaciei]
MTTIILLILAYVIGSIPSGLWVGKLFYNTDIREHGSGNLGGTNTFRTLGKKAGIAVTIMDILKGTVATALGLLPIFESTNVHPLILGIIAVVGHMFPIFAKFKGGKAVATSGGILLGYNWPIFVLLIVGFLIVLKITKMVSLTSMILAIVAVIYSIIYYFSVKHDVPLIGIVLLIAIFIFYRHRSNIKRIKAGTEPKVKWI